MPIRIAIIDSGVHSAHPHVQGVAGGIGVDDDGQLRADYIDRLGHGTAVAAVIREKVPGAHLYAIKVFDRELQTTGIALVAAMRWARQLPVDIVNLSLGTANPDHEDPLTDELDAMHAAGIVVVAAAPEPDRRWLPGALRHVVRVTMDISLPRDACIVTDQDGIQTIRASGYPRPIPGVPPEKNLKGSSFAVANATGWLANRWTRERLATEG